MARPNGFVMQLATVARPRSCDVCTDQLATEWVETLVGNIPQSDICLDCAKDAAAIVAPAPDRMAAARAAKAAKAAERELEAVAV